ncbi:hypothetical protein IWX48DRAFT_620014 [Phyllosticta citricarpa]
MAFSIAHALRLDWTLQHVSTYIPLDHSIVLSSSTNFTVSRKLSSNSAIARRYSFSNCQYRSLKMSSSAENSTKSATSTTATTTTSSSSSSSSQPSSSSSSSSNPRQSFSSSSTHSSDTSDSYGTNTEEDPMEALCAKFTQMSADLQEKYGGLPATEAGPPR